MPYNFFLRFKNFDYFKLLSDNKYGDNIHNVLL